MGLLDILNGMQNGPKGQRQAPPPTQPGSRASSGSGGGLSPVMKALLGLVAYNAVKGRGGQAATPGQSAPFPPGGPVTAGKPGGSLADMLPGGLGGLLGGAAAGGVLSGGLGNILKQLQSSGQGRVAQSWVGTGANEEIAPDELANALGGDTLDALSRQTGMPRDELLEGLSQYLPELVDKLTPDGRLPSPEEAGRMV